MISGFGKWTVMAKKKREGRNPQTGEDLTIDARRVVTFKASILLRDVLSIGDMPAVENKNLGSGFSHGILLEVGGLMNCIRPSSLRIAIRFLAALTAPGHQVAAAVFCTCGKHA
jgi:hypothetical protein